MKQIILTKGLPASGKSTWAKEYVRDNKGWARINNDDLSSMILGDAFVKGAGNIISFLRLDLVKKLMSMKRNIIIDATNLHPDRLTEIETIVNLYNADSANTDKYEVKTKDFTHIPVAECIRRNRLRENAVPDKAIYDMYHSYLVPTIEEAAQNSKLPRAIVVDIDGTIARNVSRNIYDHTRYYEDAPITDVLSLIWTLEAAGNKVVFLTGRDDDGRDVTIKWLIEKAGFKNYTCVPVEELATTERAFSLIMRPAKGDRSKLPDYEYKELMFNELLKDKFYVAGWFEDRIRNIEMARTKLGLTAVFQVGEGNF